jgi:hypothetical protein
VPLLLLVCVLIFVPDHPPSSPPLLYLLLFTDLQHTRPRQRPSAIVLLGRSWKVSPLPPFS